jgi:2'-5' RNA ligase
MTESLSIRCFVALPVPIHISQALSDLQRRLRSELDSRALRWVNPEQIHLTMLFLGEVQHSRVDEMRSALKKACRDLEPIELEAHEIGCFPNARKPKVLWTGLHGDVQALQALQSRIARELQPFVERPDTKSFHPHLTLARVKFEDKVLPSRLASVMNSHQMEPIPWTVREVLLMESVLRPEGPLYSVLQSLELGPDLVE